MDIRIPSERSGAVTLQVSPRVNMLRQVPAVLRGQTQFIDGVFVANRDRDSTGAALGQVVQEFRAVNRQGRRCASCRAEASSSAGEVYGGLWKNSTYFQRAARAVHLNLDIFSMSLLF